MINTKLTWAICIAENCFFQRGKIRKRKNSIVLILQLQGVSCGITYHIQYVDHAPKILKCLFYRSVSMSRLHFVPGQPIPESIYLIYHDDSSQPDYVPPGHYCYRCHKEEIDKKITNKLKSALSKCRNIARKEKKKKN